jgi:hypothetical protein
MKKRMPDRRMEDIIVDRDCYSKSIQPAHGTASKNKEEGDQSLTERLTTRREGDLHGFLLLDMPDVEQPPAAVIFCLVVESIVVSVDDDEWILIFRT